jgi:predicted dehydrogenase/threonine dehydrogenase-like Zn-dependent dehydrogenase
MIQLTQKLKNGAMQVLEVPTPALKPGTILVRNHYSLVSAGTEASTVKAARKGYLGKALERPQQAKQVLDTIKTQGLVQTYRAVMKRLDAYSPLGYSCAGEVIDCALDVKWFRVGDFVACGGLTASHAEVVCVPANLAAPLDRGADLKQAAYNTLGAIALQGVRQADLRLGESCAVIGLGLIGQLTGLLLRASGVRVIGVDIAPTMVEMAGKHSADFALVRNESGIDEKILRFTGGLGCDAIIITAASDSLDPINFAGAICRKRGTVVVVGAVPTGFDREPHFYRKELQVKMSCSYGPGRYDPVYEEKGKDYPAAYVRWTENRNMQAFQDLLQSGRVDVSYLTTHVFPIAEAPSAYEMLLEKKEPFAGILIQYDQAKGAQQRATRVQLKTQGVRPRDSQIGIGFIGAGSYAQSHLLPNLPKDGRIVLRGVMTTTGTSARSVGERFGFEYCTSDAADIFEDESIHAVFIASRHDSHAQYVIAALQARKHVFVEKPLCLNEAELSSISEVHGGIVATGQPAPLLMVGYNRRFSPFAQMIRKELGTGTMAMLYRVNAGSIPPDSWIQDSELGGGRIVGEVCHFVDFLINGSLPVSVNAFAMTHPHGLDDTLMITLSFENGSIGTIAYLANGDKNLPKERIEIFANASTCVLDDYRKLMIYAKGRTKEKKLLSQDKGQASEIMAYIEAIVSGSSELIPFDQIHSASRATFKMIEMLRSGQHVPV